MTIHKSPEEIQSAYKDGHTDAQVATLWGCCEPTAASKRNSLGIKPQPSGRHPIDISVDDPETLAWVKEIFATHTSMAATANALGVSKYLAHKIILAIGIEARPRGRPKSKPNKELTKALDMGLSYEKAATLAGFNSRQAAHHHKKQQRD